MAMATRMAKWRKTSACTKMAFRRMTLRTTLVRALVSIVEAADRTAFRASTVTLTRYMRDVSLHTALRIKVRLTTDSNIPCKLPMIKT